MRRSSAISFAESARTKSFSLRNSANRVKRPCPRSQRRYSKRVFLWRSCVRTSRLSQTGQRHFGGNGGAGSFDSSAIMRKRVSVAAGVRCTVSNGSNQKAWQYGQSETSTAEPRSASTVTSRIALRQPGQFIFRSLGHHGNGSNPCLSLRSLARTAR